MPEPGCKLIGFFTDGPSFDGGSLERGALGGSETALVQMARELARRGHEVVVFNRCDRAGLFDQVRYYPLAEFPGRSVGVVYDVFIVSRFFNFFKVPLSARLKVLWNHDILDRPQSLRAVLPHIDLVFVLSRFHRDNYLTKLPELEHRIVVTQNGLDLALIDRAVTGTVKKPGKMIYASRPERGLWNLLSEIWPKLAAAKPGLKLHLCGYNPQASGLDEETVRLYERIDRLAEARPDVINLGNLPKEKYYEHLASAELMLYPCNFPETSCIAALEAQACRTPILTTDGFALAETVKAEELRVKGRPGIGRYNDDYVQKALELLERPEWARCLAEQCRSEVIETQAWPVIAAQWDRLFDLHLASRPTLGLGKAKAGGNRYAS